MAAEPLVDAVVFDLDGTVYLGEAALPGAVEGITGLRTAGVRTMFVSNKPLEPREVYAAKLTRPGIPTPGEDVITSAFVLAHYLAAHEPGLCYYIIGEEYLWQELRGAGLCVAGELVAQDAREVIEPEGIDAIVVALDRTLDYRKLNTAYQALRRALDSSPPMPMTPAPCLAAPFRMPAPRSPHSTSSRGDGLNWWRENHRR